jgi:hypothetical protein
MLEFMWAPDVLFDLIDRALATGGFPCPSLGNHHCQTVAPNSASPSMNRSPSAQQMPKSGEHMADGEHTRENHSASVDCSSSEVDFPDDNSCIGFEAADTNSNSDGK